MPQDHPQLIKSNAYCSIYLVEVDGRPMILKKYVPEMAPVGRQEGESVTLYYNVTRGQSFVIQGEAFPYDRNTNSLLLHFVPGQNLAQLLRQGIHNRRARAAAIEAVESFGGLLTLLRRQTLQPPGNWSPFHYEYLLHATKTVKALPLVGSTLVRCSDDDVTAEWHALCASAEQPSFAHADAGPHNVHVHEGKIAFIDFTHSDRTSHTLSDIYCFYLSICQMPLAPRFRRDLLDAFKRGLGPVSASTEARSFFWHYQKRRWLLLRFCSRSWKQTTTGLLGLCSVPTEEPLFS